jgi:MSHA pilin protein MshC
MGRHTAHGFTMIELITVITLIGILAVVAMPNLNVTEGYGATSFRDRVAASLRFGQKSAVAKRRLVCAKVADDGLSLALTVDASFGAGTCANALMGPDGKPAVVSPAATVTLTPQGTFYFQPSGTVTSDAVGTTPASYTLKVTGQTSITVNGATGYVD